MKWLILLSLLFLVAGCVIFAYGMRSPSRDHGVIAMFSGFAMALIGGGALVVMGFLYLVSGD